MACNTNITSINPTEYIGNSLETINENFANLRDGVNITCNNILSATNVLGNLQNIANTLQGFATGRAKAWVVFDGTKDGGGAVNPADTDRFIIGSYNILGVTKNTSLEEGGGQTIGYGVYEIDLDNSQLNLPEELEPGEFPPYGVAVTSSFALAVGSNRPTWAQPRQFLPDRVVIEVTDGQASPYYADPDRVTVVIF
jgi:hypothetical protein